MYTPQPHPDPLMIDLRMAVAYDGRGVQGSHTSVLTVEKGLHFHCVQLHYDAAELSCMNDSIAAEVRLCNRLGIGTQRRVKESWPKSQRLTFSPSESSY